MVLVNAAFTFLVVDFFPVVIAGLRKRYFVDKGNVGSFGVDIGFVFFAALPLCIVYTGFSGRMVDSDSTLEATDPAT